MQLHEVWTDDQFDENVRSLMSEMRGADYAAFAFTAKSGFSAIVNFSTAARSTSMVNVGHWTSEVDAYIGRTPEWTVATCGPSEISDLRLSLGLEPGEPSRASIESGLGTVTCEGLPGARKSPVYRDASGTLFSEHAGDDVTVITIGGGTLPSQRLHPVGTAELETLIENWGALVRKTRESHI